MKEAKRRSKEQKQQQNSILGAAGARPKLSFKM